MRKYEVKDLAALVDLGSWHEVGSGTLAAIVDKEASKKLGKSSHFAGRDGALIDLKAGRGWLVDMTENDRQFSQGCPVMSQEKIKTVLGLTIELESLSKFGPWTVDRAGHAWAKAGSRYAVIAWGDSQEVKAYTVTDPEGLAAGTLQTFSQVMALTQPPKPVVSQRDFERLYGWLYKHEQAAEKYRGLAAEYDKLSKDTMSVFYSQADAFQRERGDLLMSDREVIAYMLALRGIDPTKEAQKPAKDTGFKVITLDRKELHIKPAKALKEKVVKALTAPAKKRPKSKSRARLEASRAAIKSLDKTAADFTAFCKQINAGRKVPYSLRNCMLLFDQSNGQATEVKGYQGWKQAGRVVKKGSQALVIEAPKLIKGTDKDGKEVEHLICTPCCVFDVSQTEELKETKEA